MAQARNTHVNQALLAIPRRAESELPRGLDALADAATAVEVVGEVERETSFTGSTETTHATDTRLGLDTTGAHASGASSQRHRRSATASGRLRRTGVPRDAINIAALAAQRAHDAPISVRHIRHAAHDWYLPDKHAAIAADESQPDTSWNSMIDVVLTVNSPPWQ